MSNLSSPLHVAVRLLARVAAVALFVAASPSSAASQGEAPELSSLKPTSAPAFILLNVAPSEVERPSNPSDLALSLVNSTGRFSELPENYALESAPYWLTTHKTLTWQQDSTRTLGQSVARTLSFSLASAEIGDESSPITGLSFGGRTMLFSGRYSKETRDSLDMMAQVLAQEGTANLNAAKARLEADIDAWFAAEMEKPNPDRAAIAAELRRLRAAVDDAVLLDPDYQRRVKALRERFDNFAIRREGPMLEIAGGAAWGFPNRTWEAGTLRRWGAWATYGCEACATVRGAPPITPVLMVRYLGGEDDVEGDVLDVGGRLIVNDPRYGLSVEGVWRQFTGDGDAKDLYRIAGTIEYQVRRDMWLQATFGRDQDSSSEGSLLAQLGFKFNFAEQRYKP
ncbi:MAG TPA: hypothetical protein VF006_28755 [Longimicrobium sp.]